MPLAGFCHDLGNILKGKASFDPEEGVCKISIPRVELELTILGVPTLASHSFIFQPIPNSHKALITGDLALTEDEVPHVVAALTKECIVVSAIHNHWLFDCPHLIYVHVEARARSKEFAQKIACILEQLPGHRIVDFDGDDV